MRNFNHIILDFESHKSHNTSKYWVHKTINSSNSLVFLNSIDMFSKLSNNYQFDKTLNSYLKLTLTPNTQQDTYNRLLLNDSNLYHLYSDISLDLTNFRDNNIYREYIFSKTLNKSTLILEQKLAKLLSSKISQINTFSPSNNLTNVNFLRKERLYTKLKYSRSPAYDIVSGGSAALLAAFLGFLISEKYGFEMVDSGDFYFLFMYLVFISFSIRPLLITLNSNNSVYSIFTIKPVISYFLNLFYLILKKIK